MELALELGLESLTTSTIPIERKNTLGFSLAEMCASFSYSPPKRIESFQ